MKASRLISTKRIYPDGMIIEVVIWYVPASVLSSRHRYKYSLFCGWPGRRVVGFDNERGKGDHCHIRGIESRYEFSTLEQLLADFAAAVQRETGRRP